MKLTIRRFLPGVECAWITLAALPMLACQSSLDVGVDRYQGELILVKTGRELRLKSLVLGAQISIENYLLEGKALLESTKASPHKPTLEAALGMLLSLAGRNPLAPDPVQDAAREDLLRNWIKGVEGNKAALQGAATVEEFLLEKEWLEPLRTGVKPEAEPDIYLTSLWLAERFQAFARTLEGLDQDLLDNLKRKPRFTASKRSGPALSQDEQVTDFLSRVWMTFEESYPRIAGLSNFGIAHSNPCPEQGDPRSQLEAAAKKLFDQVPDAVADLMAGAVSSAEERAGGDIAEPGSRAQQQEPARKEPESKEPATKDGGDAKEPKAGGIDGLKGRLEMYFDAVEYAQVRLNELENPYVPVHSAGAYLGLEEMQEAIKAQNRPGFDIGKTWQNITRVKVEAGANANYVVMRDHVGNWQVKATRNDPTELINAAYGGALAVIDLATQKGQATQNLREAYQKFAKEQEAGIATPIAMQNLLDLLEKRHAEDLKPVDEAIVAARKKVADAQAVLGGTPKPEEKAKAKAEQDEEAGNEELRKQLAKKLGLQEGYSRDLELIEQALAGVETPKAKEEPAPAPAPAAGLDPANPSGGGGT